MNDTVQPRASAEELDRVPCGWRFHETVGEGQFEDVAQTSQIALVFGPAQQDRENQRRDRVRLPPFEVRGSWVLLSVAFLNAAQERITQAVSRGRRWTRHGLCASGEWLLYDPQMRRTRTSPRWMRFALAFVLAPGLAVMSGAAQRPNILTNGRNLQIPINHGLPDKPLGFTYCRLRYENVRRARKSGWGDDYPQADYNFMVRLSELTKTTISRWNDDSPGFANVTAMDPDLFQCPYLRMQNAANYDFTPEEAVRMHDYLLKGGFLWIDDNWDPDFNYIRPNLMRILPGATIVDLPVDHPMFSVMYRVDPLPQIPSLGSWQRTGQDSEIGPSTVHYYGVFDDHDRLVVLVSMNSDVSDSWEREGDSQDYFRTFSGKGYALGVNVAVWAMTH